MTILNDMSSQCTTFLLDVFFCASCKLITSNFSAMAFISSTSISAMFSPNRVLTGVSSVSDISTNISESGTDKPCSHFETVCRTTFSFTASSCCERPFAFLIVFIISKCVRCYKQRILTSVQNKNLSIIIYNLKNGQFRPGTAHIF